jgi:hypothetical protein
MAALTAATTERPHVLGDIKLLVFSFAAVANADTFVVPGTGMRILGMVDLQVSTSASVNATISGQTATFIVSAGTPACTLGFLVA